MSRAVTLAAVAATFLIAGCAGSSNDGGPRLQLVPPKSGQGVSFVQSDASLSEVAAAYRAAGFTDVIRSASAVRVRTRSDAFVDCGTMRQFALGNRAEFPGSSSRAAILTTGRAGSVLLRTVDIRSTATITQGAPGTLNISENHSITVEYRGPGGTLFSRDRVSFDQDGAGQFRDNASCVSSGGAARIL